MRRHVNAHTVTTTTWVCSGEVELMDKTDCTRQEEGPAEGGEPFSIASEDAYVVSANARCWRCRAVIEVVCIYCATGEILGDRYEGFAVSNITAVDAALWRQLERWPSFRFGYSHSAQGRYLANHCPSCRALQGDYFLHCEPAGAFFALKGAAPGAIALTPLLGQVRLSGDEGFEP